MGKGFIIDKTEQDCLRFAASRQLDLRFCGSIASLISTQNLRQTITTNQNTSLNPHNQLKQSHSHQNRTNKTPLLSSP
jgi:hypothetical protein